MMRQTNRNGRKTSPGVESLEGRQLLSISPPIGADIPLFGAVASGRPSRSAVPFRRPAPWRRPPDVQTWGSSRPSRGRTPWGEACFRVRPFGPT